jgi:hypothetical protein
VSGDGRRITTRGNGTKLEGSVNQAGHSFFGIHDQREFAPGAA